MKPAEPELPSIRLDMNGNSFEATPLNSCLYTFCGRSALPTGEVIENASRNHVFLRTGETYVNEEGNDVITGSYIFGEAVPRIGAVMLQNQFPAELHKRGIHAADEAAYQNYIGQQETADDIEDYIPEEFYGN